MSRRRVPDPPHTPPTDAEIDLGYYLDCPNCDLRWSMRFVDRHLSRCIPCARAWRRDDRLSRYHKRGGVPLAPSPPHPFRSRVLGREIDLNSSAARDLVQSDDTFRDEVTRYVTGIVSENATTPIRGGILTLLSPGRRRGKPVRVDLPEEPPAPVSDDVRQQVNQYVDTRMDAIDVDGEVVEESTPRSKRKR